MRSSARSEPEAAPLPSYEDVRRAALRLAGHAVLTPLLEAPLLNQATGGRILVKAEPLQRTGSFKFRGAYNRISLIPAAERAAGVVTYSSGNHAQGVAAAARLLGLPAVIVMPKDAPAMKVANTRAYGAEVVFYDRYTEIREEIGERIAVERGATIVRPYDDPGVIAGQGTVGLELAQQAKVLGVKPDAVLVPCGGGGLVAGTALALAHDLPGVPVYSVEPAGFDDTKRSLATGARLANDPTARSICDALLAPTPGALTFQLNRLLLAGGIAVTDAEAKQAMAAAFGYLKLVVEPGGAVALAAALTGKLEAKGKTIAVVASGGNVDAAPYVEALSG
ncbi:MAG: threonine/serine dehydratase [Proteobacteria bacterium]|nr:threonine/serine dehydratase [Pseudomonadota bacterium]MBI3497481.1 threonine/serine dehydratase [Pseudomonadota bacterium]